MKKLAGFILVLCMMAVMFPLSVSASDTISVDNLDALQSALNNDDVKTVIVSETITLPDGTELDGKGKTVSVSAPYLSPGGNITSDYADYGVFIVSNGSDVTIKNMTILGGGYDYLNDLMSSHKFGGIYNNGTLKLENVNIARGYRGIVNDSSGKLTMVNTNIVNNAAKYGGGLLNYSTLVMDGCSLSGNRSLCAGFGGGAAENWGTMYINNSVIANNCSSETGGAINNKGRGIYVMNSTFTGNVTTETANYGGSIGNQDNSPLYAVNTIFAGNYSIKNGEVKPSDISAYRDKNSYGCVILHNCLYNYIYSPSDRSDLVFTFRCSCIDDTKARADVFATYETTGINCGEEDKTASFTHSVLIPEDSRGYALNTPVKAGGEATDGGIYATYFDYSDINDVKMSYKISADSDMIPFGNRTVADESKKVTSFYGGNTRSDVNDYIGASDAGITVYTIGGSVKKASITQATTTVPDCQVLIYEIKNNSETLVDSISTDKNGNYLSHGLPAGEYKAKSTLDSRIAEEEVTISADNVTGADLIFEATGFYMPVIDCDIIGFDVEGLEQEAARLYAGYTDPVELTLTLRCERQGYDETNTKHVALKKAAGESKKLDIYEIGLQKKELFSDSGPIENPLDGSGTLLSLILPVSASKIESDGFAVFAYDSESDDSVKEFTKLEDGAEPAEGKYKLNANGSVNIYTKKCGTYGVAYDTGKLDLSDFAVNYSGLPVFSLGSDFDYDAYKLPQSAAVNAPQCDFSFGEIAYWDGNVFCNTNIIDKNIEYYVIFTFLWEYSNTEPFSSITYPSSAYAYNQYFEEPLFHCVQVCFKLGTPEEINAKMGVPSINNLPDAYYGETAGEYISAIKAGIDNKSIKVQNCSIDKDSIHIWEKNPLLGTMYELIPEHRLSNQELYVLSFDLENTSSASGNFDKILVNGMGVPRSLDNPNPVYIQFVVPCLYVNGEIIEPNTPYSGTEGTLNFNAQNAALTLNGFKDTAERESEPHIFYGSELEGKGYNLSRWQQPLNISWDGDCEVESIISSAGLNLNGGSGTLTVKQNLKHNSSRFNNAIAVLYGDININKGSRLKITSEYGDGFNVEEGNINIYDGTVVDIDAEDDGIYANFGNIDISGGDLNIVCSDEGIHANNYLKISGGTIGVDTEAIGLSSYYADITGGVLDIDAVRSSVSVYEYCRISGGKISLKSIESCGIITGDFQMTGGTLDIKSYKDDGIYLHGDLSKGAGSISGGELTINAGGNAFVTKNLYVTGGYVSAVGENRTLNIGSLYEDNRDNYVEDWEQWYGKGGVYYVYNGTEPLVQVGDKTFTGFRDAVSYAFENEIYRLTVLRNIPAAGSVITDGSHTLTIDAAGYNVGNLNIFCTESAENPGVLAEFENAAKLKGSLSFENEDLLDYYYNEGQDTPIAVKGVSAARFGVSASGYTMYKPAGDTKELTVIGTDEAVFAVAETVLGERVSAFRFYKTFDAAKTASATAAIPNTIYVLNYVNLKNPEAISFSQVDLSEETENNPIDLSGLTLATVSRITDGTFSTFYDYDEENKRPVSQYNNGGEIIPESNTNMKATLIGNFTGNHEERNIIINNKTAFTTLNLRGVYPGSANKILYMTNGELAPSFNVHSRSNYTLEGYYTSPLGGTKVINGDGTVVAGVTIGDDVVFNEDSKWQYGKNLTLYAHWEINRYTVTFDANGHGTAPAARTRVIHGTGITAPVAPTAEGYTFEGWYRDPQCTKVWNFGSDTVTENITLYAKWKEAEEPYNPQPTPEPEPDTYLVNVLGSINGSVTVDKNTASPGSTVTITAAPAKGFVVKDITVLDKNNKALVVKNQGNNKFSFIMPECEVKVKAAFIVKNAEKILFVDVKEKDYFHDAVYWAVANGITFGVDDTHFDPKGITTRGQMVSFLWRAAGCPEPATKTCKFKDVIEGKYYYKAVLWAVENGITYGTDATTFSPNLNVNRAQAVTFLARMSGVKDKVAGYSHSFTDVKASDYFNNAVAWAYANKITVGTSASKFSPKDYCQRAQVVCFLYRNFVK